MDTELDFFLQETDLTPVSAMSSPSQVCPLSNLWELTPFLLFGCSEWRVKASEVP